MATKITSGLVKLKINQMFKGQQATQYFGADGTYQTSMAVDCDLPIISTDIRTSGYAVPVGYAKFSSTNITSPVIREITNPKDNLLWTVQTNGKVVVYTSALAGETLIGTVAGSNARWAEYYNNYIYIFGTATAKNDISRVGPLNTLPYDGQSGNFTVGLTITGGTSAATGVIIADVDAGATGTLTLSNIKGLFVDNETITDTGTGSAAVNRALTSLIADAVWTGATLGSQTALSDTVYPSLRSVMMPNHVAHVHGDNSLYFCDFGAIGTTIAGQGALHRISTKKVTNEGDTNGTVVPSLYNALDLPFGFYPTVVDNYSTSLLITGIYTIDTTTNQGGSAFILWDPVNTTSFYVGPVPLPDPLCTAVKNVNGVIHFWTGNAVNGVRLSRYLGGQSVQEVVYQEEGLPPLAGAVDALGNRIVWGGFATNPAAGAVVYAWGSKDARLPAGLHNICKTTAATTTPFVTALKYVQQNSNITPKIVPAWTDTSAANSGIDQYSTTGTLASILRFLINLGEAFDLREIKIPLAGAVNSTTTIIPTLYFDDLSTNLALTTINNTNYPSKRKIVYGGTELKNTLARNNLVLEFAWTNTSPLPIGFPITLTLDVKEDETS